MTYQEYLRSDDWQQKRTAKLGRTKRCGICGATDRLDVHHLNYRDLFSVTLSDLRVLCRRCHYLAHDLHRAGTLRFTSDNHHSRFTLTKTAVKRVLRAAGKMFTVSANGFVVTQEWVISHSTAQGGYTRQQLAAISVPWPPPKGWLSAAIGRKITTGQKTRFEART